MDRQIRWVDRLDEQIDQMNRQMDGQIDKWVDRLDGQIDQMGRQVIWVDRLHGQIDRLD